jgi:hypothetical protein
MKRSLWSVAVALPSIFLGMASGLARAEDAPRSPPPALTGPADGFGLPGQIAVSADLQLALIHSSAGSSSSTGFVIQPAGDYFVAPHISVGGLIGYGRGSASAGLGPGSVSGTTTVLVIGVRGGYDIGLTSLISLWPTLTLGYEHQSTTGVGNTDVSGYSIPLEIFAPFLFHVAPHLFLGLGPIFGTELANSVEGNDQPKTTRYGFQSVVGGYFGGT